MSCKEQKKSVVEKFNLKNCDCENIIKADSVFYATNVIFEADKFTAIFSCASIEVGIASVTDPDGNDICENMYFINCISNEKQMIKISNNFSYFSEYLPNMDLKKAEAQSLFFDESKSKAKNFFMFTLNKDKEVSSIYRLKVE